MDLGMKGCLRTDAFTPIIWVLAETDEENGVCTVILYAFHEEDLCSEFCMVWGNVITLRGPTSDMEDPWRKTEGPCFANVSGFLFYIQPGKLQLPSANVLNGKLIA